MTVDKEIEKRIAELKKQYQALPQGKKEEIKNDLKRRNFIDYKKVEMIKAELLRLEAKRANLELCEQNQKLTNLEKKIQHKKEKLAKCLGRNLYQP